MKEQTVSLVDRASVERLRHKYLHLLHRYLRSRLPSSAAAAAHTGRLIELPRLAREAYAIHQRMLPI